MFEGIKWKLIEQPLLAVRGSHVDAFSFLGLFFLLLVAGCAFSIPAGRRWRWLIQAAAFVFFIFAVHRCFCALRGCLLGLQEIGRNDLKVFEGLFVFVPLSAFTLIFGRVFCGWICPFGTIQEFFFRIRRLREFMNVQSVSLRRVRMAVLVFVLACAIALLFLFRPDTFFFVENFAAFLGISTVTIALFSLWGVFKQEYLRRFRYLVLGSTLAIIVAGVFVTDPWCTFYGNEVDYSSLVAFSAVVMAALVVSMAWCRYICPLGTYLGILSKIARRAVKREKKTEPPDMICYAGLLDKDRFDGSSCMCCGRCLEAGVSRVEEKG